MPDHVSGRGGSDPDSQTPLTFKTDRSPNAESIDFPPPGNTSPQRTRVSRTPSPITENGLNIAGGLTSLATGIALGCHRLNEERDGKVYSPPPTIFYAWSPAVYHFSHRRLFIRSPPPFNPILTSTFHTSFLPLFIFPPFPDVPREIRSPDGRSRAKPYLLAT